MKRNIAIFIVFILAAYVSVFLFAEHARAIPGKALVIREAKEDRYCAVAVEAYLEGNILEAKVSARLFRARPKITNIILVGPKIGRLSPITVTQVFATNEVEEPYPTTMKKGFISFSDSTATKGLKGAVSRKLVEIKFPPEKVKPKGSYQIWVKVKEEGSMKGGKRSSFKFDLPNFPNLVKVQNR